PVTYGLAVAPFVRRAEAIAGAEAGAGAAHVDDDHRIAAGHEEIAIKRCISCRIDRAALTQPEAAVVGREDGDGRKGLLRAAAVGPGGDIDVDGDGSRPAW